MAVDETVRVRMEPRALYRLVGAAAVAAALIVVVFVLPAEFGIDPTGFGRATGIIRLSAAAPRPGATATGPAQASAEARYYATPFRSDFVDIPLTASGDFHGENELEYKVRLKAGSTLVYSWSVPGISNPEEFYFDLHGEAAAKEPGGEPTIVQYRQATGTQSSGMLVAPLDGIFGWYLQNQSTNPVVVRLNLSGFYDLVAPGENGNYAGIEANRPHTGK
ncbi:MAG TPA: hypothetical protein VJ011_10455 [Steroidobacteraceae bacterium]|nr:hypothetical protein [Steroidobacteraceae bacterium]